MGLYIDSEKQFAYPSSRKETTRKNPSQKKKIIKNFITDTNTRSDSITSRICYRTRYFLLVNSML